MSVNDYILKKSWDKLWLKPWMLKYEPSYIKSKSLEVVNEHLAGKTPVGDLGNKAKPYSKYLVNNAKVNVNRHALGGTVGEGSTVVNPYLMNYLRQHYNFADGFPITLENVSLAGADGGAIPGSVLVARGYYLHNSKDFGKSYQQCCVIMTESGISQRMAYSGIFKNDSLTSVELGGYGIDEIQLNDGDVVQIDGEALVFLGECDVLAQPVTVWEYSPLSDEGDGTIPSVWMQAFKHGFFVDANNPEYNVSIDNKYISKTSTEQRQLTSCFVGMKYYLLNDEDLNGCLPIVTNNFSAAVCTLDNNNERIESFALATDGTLSWLGDGGLIFYGDSALAENGSSCVLDGFQFVSNDFIGVYANGSEYAPE